VPAIIQAPTLYRPRGVYPSSQFGPPSAPWLRPRSSWPSSSSRRLVVAPPGLIAVRPRSGLSGRGLAGLGVLQGGAATAAQIASSAAVLTGTILGGPLGGAIAGVISQIGVAIANAFSGCGQTCVQATAIANQVEPLLQQNLDAYMSAPIHYASLQAGALNNFAGTWNALQQACSNPSLAAAGQRCITDRQAGACTWKASPGGWVQGSDGKWSYTPWGASGSGTACWNWFVGYHDPIANDPTVVPDPSPVGSAVSSISSALSSGSLFGLPLSSLLLPAGLLLLAGLVLSD
jgi:hypothetical protein